jgi:Ca-activated chloride channel family protein
VADAGASSPDLAAIRAYVNSLQAGGGTAIYDAVFGAYQIAATAMRTEPGRLYSIVLMTDGQNNVGRDGARFLADSTRSMPARSSAPSTARSTWRAAACPRTSWRT